MGWIKGEDMRDVVDDKDYIGMFLILLFISCFSFGCIYIKALPHGFFVFAPITSAVLFFIERVIFRNRKLRKIKDKIERFMEKRKLEVDIKDIPTLALRSDELSLVIGETKSDIERALKELWEESKIEKDAKEYYYATT